MHLADGSRLHLFVEQSLGNLHRPLSDAELEDKFRDQAALALPPAQVERLIAGCRRIDELEDAGALARDSRPEDRVEAANGSRP